MKSCELELVDHHTTHRGVRNASHSTTTHIRMTVVHLLVGEIVVDHDVNETDFGKFHSLFWVRSPEGGAHRREIMY